MPRRGYRKGLSDTKTPLGRRIHTRLAEPIHQALMADAANRSTDAAKILRALATAHYKGQRLELPQSRGPSSAALRELARVGNNLNQIAHRAHLMQLHLLEVEARRCIAAINAAATQLGASC